MVVSWAGSEVVVNYIPYGRQGWTLVSVVPNSQVFGFINFLLLIATIFGVGAILLVGLVILLIIGNVFKTLTFAIANLNEGALQVNSASNQVSQSSQQLASSASQQSASIEEITSTLHEIYSMAGNNADNADSLNGIMVGDIHNNLEIIQAVLLI